MTDWDARVILACAVAYVVLAIKRFFVDDL
jgi:hypothetical protein